MNKKNGQTTTELAQERTLLAAKRTFSAWIRTGLAGIAGGLAILRIIQFKTPLHQLFARIIGHLLIIWGILVFLFAAYDYRKSHQKLYPDKTYKFSLWLLYITIPLVLISLLVLWLSF